MVANGGIIGHALQREWLARAIARKGAHAFLLYGPSGVGKRLLAEMTAREVLGHSPDHPLQEHPDVKIVEPDREAGRSTIGIDTARDVRAFLSTTPLSGDRKVVIIDEAEYLTDAAANALLKSIEEPTGDALILLVTQDRGRVLPTIRSRTLPVRFTRMDDAELKDALIVRGFDAKTTNQLVSLAGGRPGLALAFAESTEEKEAAARRMNAVTQLLHAPKTVRLVYAARAAAAGEGAIRSLPDQWLAVLQRAIRDDAAAPAPRRAARATLRFARQMNETSVRPDLLLEKALLSF